MHTFRRTELQYHEIILKIIDDYIIMIMYVVCSSIVQGSWIEQSEYTSYSLNPDLLTIIMENQFARVVSKLLLCICCSHVYNDHSDAPWHSAGMKGTL